MAHNRAAAELSIINDIEAILPGSENGKYYRAKFSKMDNAAFNAFMERIQKQEEILTIVVPNWDRAMRLDVTRNLNLGELWGHPFYERIWLDDGDGTAPYLSNHPYLIIDLPMRRQAQLLEKKISVAEDNKSVDDFTGQPTGKSKGSKISYPEMQLLAAAGLEKSTIEFIKFRGGDVKGYAALMDSIGASGGVSMSAIADQAGGVVATQTLRTLLASMHLGSTI